MKTLSENRAFGGVQGVYSHASATCRCDMTFGLFLPAEAEREPVPVLWYLSGLTCTHANVMEKGEYRAACAENGIILIAPDTSPRGDDVPDAEGEYDFGKGAGFYCDATQEPWAQHYRMRSYIEDELAALIAARFPADMARQGITGHSMGGHGALTIALRNPTRFRSVSAFAPICAPSKVPWGEKAFSRYLGNNRAAWAEYDAVAMIESGARLPDLLVDQGSADAFLAEQLGTPMLKAACEAAGIPAAIRMQESYDHSYFFISTFMADHIAWHAQRLRVDSRP
jgi:S-formylglutathione hydrolase